MMSGQEEVTRGSRWATTGVLTGRGDEDSAAQSGDRGGGREKTGVPKPRREASGETSLADTLVLNFPASETGRKFSCLRPPVWGALCRT